MTDTHTMIDQARDEGFARSDAAVLARLAAGVTGDRPKPGGSALLRRDLAGMTRAAAALRRFSRTPAGIRAGREG